MRLLIKKQLEFHHDQINQSIQPSVCPEHQIPT